MSNTDGARPTVLVVDDEALNRMFVDQVLTAVGWQVITAASGEQALDQLHRLPTLVLMDLRMEGMGGYQAVAAIRARGGAEGSIPVVAFTSTRFADERELLALGFDGYLAKPCSPEGLTALAACWLPDGSAAALDRLGDSFGGTQIDDLADGFRALLIEAVEALDAGTAEPVAHRVAGIAGTLGFARLGRIWLDVSEGRRDCGDAARIEARRAITLLDRRHRRNSIRLRSNSDTGAEQP